MLFFFISGYNYKKRGLKKELLHVFTGLVIPYFALNAIMLACGLDNIMALFHGDFVFLFDKVRTIVFGERLWFVACLIVLQLYYIIIKQLLVRDSFKLIAGVILMLSPYLIRRWDHSTSYWFYDNALFGLSYFLIGNVAKSYIKQPCFVSRATKVICALNAVAYSCVAVFCMRYFDVSFDIMTCYYTSPIYFLFISWYGIFTVLWLCFNFQIPSYFSLLGYNSLLLFGISYKSLVVLRYIFEKTGIRSILSSDYIFCPVICFCEGLLIIIIGWYVNHYAPFIVGRRKAHA